MEKEIISRIKHIETFYEQAPPGFLKDEEERPEDCIPDEECNREAREFLANAPSKGLWMPLGKEVKVMQCWRCKQYGHRTGDKECPMFQSGNSAIEKFREAYEDPMYHFVEKSKREENEKKKMWLQQLLDKSTTSDSSSDDAATSKKEKKPKKHKSHKARHKKLQKRKSKTCNDADSGATSYKTARFSKHNGTSKIRSKELSSSSSKNINNTQHHSGKDSSAKKRKHYD